MHKTALLMLKSYFFYKTFIKLCRKKTYKGLLGYTFLHTTLPVGEHFRGAGHALSYFVFTPVEKIYSKNLFLEK